MKIFKEQWAGMGMAFDLGLVKGDAEMAGAVWRNLLGARGARGIVFEPEPPPPPAATTARTTPLESSSESEAGSQRGPFRRSINLVGGLVENPAKVDQRGLEAEEARDDYSGVYDFPPHEAYKYVSYPEVMMDVVGYVRRELVRLEHVPDEEIIRGDIEALRFGRVRVK
jgi:cytochrome b pre-mRNA-processing protein 3